MSRTLALLGGQCHVLVDIPFVRGSKSTGFIHDPLHEAFLARRCRPTTPKVIDLRESVGQWEQHTGRGNEHPVRDVLSLWVSPVTVSPCCYRPVTAFRRRWRMGG